MALIRIGDESFNVVMDGAADAPALLLSNSLGTDLHMWDAQIPELSKHFRVIRYDSRGHGRSVISPGPYSIELLSRDALSILDTLDIAKASFVGLSMGGMIGQWLVTHAPERIERAVLSNTGAQMGGPDLWNMRVRTARQKGMGALVEGVIARWFTPAFHMGSQEAVARVVEMLKATPAEGYAGSSSAIRDMDQRETIRSASRPVLVIIGTQDPATPAAMGELIAAHIPGAKIARIDAAHLSNIEQPEAFTRAVLKFLTASERKPASRKTAGKAKAQKRAGKKSAAGKAVAKKAISKRAPGKKTTSRISVAKKSPPKKAGKAAKATTPRKAPAKKASARKAATKKRTRR
jgi:3-oxoadipate enol-lactonase